MDRSRTSLLVVAVGVATLAGAAVLVRPGVAVDDADVVRARASLAPSVPAVPTAPADPFAATPGDLVVRADGVDGLRLGMGVDEVVAAGFAVQERSYEGCRRVLPGLADAGPGPGVVAWLVDGTVESVAVDDRAGLGPSFVGPGLGDPLTAWRDVGGAGRVRVSVDVPWRDEPEGRGVVLLTTGSARSAAFADLSGDGVVDHVQLRTDRGAGCASARDRVTAAEQAGLPELTVDGWGPVRVGTTLTEARTLVRLQAGGDDVPTPVGRCRLVLADDEPGLSHLVVGPDPTDPAAEPVVRSVAVDAGATGTGLAVGTPAEQVRDAYPDITRAFLEDRWAQGLVAEWQLPDGAVLRLAPTREQVPVAEVDGVLRGPRTVVGSVQLGQGC